MTMRWLTSSRLGTTLLALAIGSAGCGRIGYEHLSEAISAAGTSGAEGLGGAPFGGTSSGGVAESGGSGGLAGNGGVESGGGTSGGGTSGAMTSGGTGGANTGDAGAGGLAGGGAPAGGTMTGGTPVGGAPTGGAPAGGVPTGGAPTSGAPTGGAPTGGAPTGGVPTGGAQTGGAPTGGAGGAGGAVVCVPDATCSCSNYAGRDYRFCTTPTVNAYDDAQANCEAQGMTLLQINDATENAWVTQQALAAGLLVSGSIEVILLGGDQLAVGGEWYWLDGTLFWNNGPVGAYTNWETDPKASGISDCVALHDTGLWTARTCNTSNAYFVCEPP